MARHAVNQFANTDTSNYTSKMKRIVITEEEKTTIKKVNSGALKREVALVALGLSQSTFYAHKQKLGIKRPTGVSKKATEAAKKTRAARGAAAQMVVDGRATFEEARALAKLHRITFQRWINKVKARAK